MRNVIYTTFLLLFSSLSFAHDLTIAKDIDTKFIEQQIKNNIEYVQIEDSLPDSGLVKQTFEVNGIYWLEGSRVMVDFDFYSKGAYAEYTERMTYVANVRPYIDYQNDSVGIYPNKPGNVQSFFDNPFTRKDMNRRVISDVVQIVDSALINAYLNSSDLTNEVKSQISQYDGHMEFLVDFTSQDPQVSVVIKENN